MSIRELIEAVILFLRPSRCLDCGARMKDAAMHEMDCPFGPY